MFSAILDITAQPSKMISNSGANYRITGVIITRIYPLHSSTYIIIMYQAWKKSFIVYRYMRVQYEDLFSDTLGTLRQIYRFLGQPFTAHEARVAWEHSHFKRPSGTNYRVNSGYYFTYVRPDFVHDKWKKELNHTVCENTWKKVKHRSLFWLISDDWICWGQMWSAYETARIQKIRLTACWYFGAKAILSTVRPLWDLQQEK